MQTQLCTIVHSCAQLCTIPVGSGHVSNCTIGHNCAPLCTVLCTLVHNCASLCTSVQCMKSLSSITTISNYLKEKIQLDYDFQDNQKNNKTDFHKLLVENSQNPLFLFLQEFIENEEQHNRYLQDDKQVIINRTEISGPCTKLIGSIDIIPNDAVVIILDDDMVMRSNFISSLYESYKKNPSKISSTYVTRNNYFTEVAGFAGFILKMTDTIRELKKYYLIMPTCVKYIDDTWFGWCFHRIGIDVINGLEPDPWNNILDIPNTDPHPEWHELCKNTNRQQLTMEFLKYILLNEK